MPVITSAISCRALAETGLAGSLGVAFRRDDPIHIGQYVIQAVPAVSVAFRLCRLERGNEVRARLFLPLKQAHAGCHDRPNVVVSARCDSFGRKLLQLWR